jgi:hypothetical protein
MPTPTQVILDSQGAPATVTDGEGRLLQLRRLTALDKLRLFKAVGPVLSQNEPYLGMAILACSVSAIDGVPVPAPTTEAQIEGLVSRLGDAGLAAAATVLEPSARVDPGEIRALAGN